MFSDFSQIHLYLWCTPVVTWLMHFNDLRVHQVASDLESKIVTRGPVRSLYHKPCDTPQHVSTSQGFMTTCNMSQAM